MQQSQDSKLPDAGGPIRSTGALKQVRAHPYKQPPKPKPVSAATASSTPVKPEASDLPGLYFPPTETDPHRIAQRQKQIDMAKNTLAYDRYTQQVPRNKREPAHPRTPDIHWQVSKRQFDGLIRSWKAKLHKWDAVQAPASANGVGSGGGAAATGSNASDDEADDDFNEAELRAMASTAHLFDEDDAN